MISSKKYVDETMDAIREAGKSNIKYFISMDLSQKTGDVYSQKELIRVGKDLLKKVHMQKNQKI